MQASRSTSTSDARAVEEPHPDVHRGYVVRGLFARRGESQQSGCDDAFLRGQLHTTGAVDCADRSQEVTLFVSTQFTAVSIVFKRHLASYRRNDKD